MHRPIFYTNLELNLWNEGEDGLPCITWHAMITKPASCLGPGLSHLNPMDMQVFEGIAVPYP